MPGTDGLVHISQIAQERVNKVTDYFSEGQKINVKVMDVNARGRIKLSMKDVSVEEGGLPPKVSAEAKPEPVPVADAPQESSAE